MKRTFELIHYATPKSLNAGGAGSRRHWGAAYREKRFWQNEAAVALLVMKVPKGMSFCTMSAMMRWKHRRRRDPENYSAPLVKPYADELVKAGYLPDDTDEFFRFAGLTFEVWDTDTWVGLAKSVTTVTLECTYS